VGKTKKNKMVLNHAVQIPGIPNFSRRQNMKQSLSEYSWDSFTSEYDSNYEQQTFKNGFSQRRWKFV